MNEVGNNWFNAFTFEINMGFKVCLIFSQVTAMGKVRAMATHIRMTLVSCITIISLISSKDRLPASESIMTLTLFQKYCLNYNIDDFILNNM